MPLQTSGAISLNNINVELGNAGTATISMGAAASRDLAGVASGPISLNNFYGASAVAPPGSQTFTASGTFTVPSGHTSVTICMVGGGGGGRASSSGWCGAPVQAYYCAEGGRNGQVVSTTINGLTAGENITVTVGSGGAGKAAGSNINGGAGTSSSFATSVGTWTATGGAGGTETGWWAPTDYTPIPSGSVAYCGGTFSYGTSYGPAQCGPQAGTAAGGGYPGGFGNGGNAAVTSNAAAGSVGAGGGGSSNVNYASGAGGRGQVVVSWG